MKFVNAALLLVSFLVFNSCGLTEQDPIARPNRILYSAEVNGKLQIFSVNPDGTDKRQITSGKYWHDNVKSSLDGKTIICATEERSTTAGISMAVMNHDGSSRRLVGNLWAYHLSLSPDGRMIAYSFMPMAELGERNIYIYLCDINGNSNRRLTDDMFVRETSPVWSADGRRIYFVSNRIDPTQISGQLYYVDLSDKSAGINKITHYDNREFYSLSISRDGTKIAAMSIDSSSGIASICTLKTDGTDYGKVVTAKNGYYVMPGFSPDGKSIALLGIKGDGSKEGIKIVNTDGTNLHTVINDNSINTIDWMK